MAAGVPVVSTNAGGLPEVIVEGVPGFMGNVGDVDTMSEKAIAILRDDETLDTFRRGASAHARQFDITNIVPLYEELYERFLVKAVV